MSLRLPTLRNLELNGTSPKKAPTVQSTPSIHLLDIHKPVRISQKYLQGLVPNKFLEAYFEALGAMGIPKTNGSIGRFWLPTALNPERMTRSYAKNEYHDTAVPRPNYHLLHSNTVTKILFRAGKRATGVQYAAGPDASVFSVSAKKEVILSAGGIFSPTILLQSGIGEKKKLQDLNIPVVADVPGVGWNFQDHTRFDFKFNCKF